MELKVSNVRKMYNKTVAVKNANLYLERGIYGLLGLMVLEKLHL